MYQTKQYYLNKKASTGSLINERIEHNLSSNNSLYKPGSKDKGLNIFII